MAKLLTRVRGRLAEARRVAELNGGAPLADFRDYDEYWERRAPVTVLHRRWEVAAARIADGSSVLDVGCGTGKFLEHVRRERPHCSVRGVDVSAVAVAATREAGIDARVLDVEREDLDGVADYVTCLEVIEHIAHAEAVLRRLVDASRREVIVSIPNVGFIGCRIRLALFGRFPTTLCVFHAREHLRFWTVKDFREWTEACGYELVASYPQHGIWGLWRIAPSLFASGMVYVVR